MSLPPPDPSSPAGIDLPHLPIGSETGAEAAADAGDATSDEAVIDPDEAVIDPDEEAGGTDQAPVVVEPSFVP